MPIKTVIEVPLAKLFLGVDLPKGAEFQSSLALGGQVILYFLADTGAPLERRHFKGVWSGESTIKESWSHLASHPKGLLAAEFESDPASPPVASTSSAMHVFEVKS